MVAIIRSLALPAVVGWLALVSVANAAGPWRDPQSNPPREPGSAHCWSVTDDPDCFCADTDESAMANNVQSPSLYTEESRMYFWVDEERLLPNRAGVRVHPEGPQDWERL